MLSRSKDMHHLIGFIIMKFLWQDSHTGKASSSKLWTHIAYGVSSYILIKNAVSVDPMLLLIYISCIGGSEIAKKILTLKYSTPKD